MVSTGNPISLPGGLGAGLELPAPFSGQMYLCRLGRRGRTSRRSPKVNGISSDFGCRAEFFFQSLGGEFPVRRRLVI